VIDLLQNVKFTLTKLANPPDNGVKTFEIQLPPYQREGCEGFKPLAGNADVYCSLSVSMEKSTSS
jgi:hypothetical protein